MIMALLQQILEAAETMVKGLIDKVDQRDDKQDKRLDAIEKRLDALEGPAPSAAKKTASSTGARAGTASTSAKASPSK